MFEFRLNFHWSLFPRVQLKIPAMVQVMAWRRPGDKPLIKPMVVSLPTHIYVTRPRWVNIIVNQFRIGIGIWIWSVLTEQMAVTMSQTFKTHFQTTHDDVIKWKHFLRDWPFVRGIHWSPVTSPHKGQWRGALMFSSICARINDWANNREAGDLRRNHVHYDVIAMCFNKCT